jgi:cytochrome c peroxidase
LGGVGHCGGLFWDGRAEGWGANYPAQPGPLGDGQVTDTVIRNDLPADKQVAYEKYLGPLVDQALNPFQKGVEQNAGEKKVCQQVKTAKYKELYEQAFGEEIDCKTKPKDNPAYHRSFQLIVLAIAAYEASDEVSPFNSRRDIALKNDGDVPPKFPLDGLTDEENLGHDLFYGETSDLGDFCQMTYHPACLCRPSSVLRQQ